jgi:hypothetical protein
MTKPTLKLITPLVLIAAGILICLLFIASKVSLAATQSTSSSYSFAAVGDIGATSQSSDVLNTLGNDSTRFALVLGDLDYDQTSSDAAWCDYVKKRVGSSYPFQLVTGNHEQQGGPDGYIMNHAKCLPDRMDSSGKYPAEYYFDYPKNTPNLRVIMISPDLTVAGIKYNYRNGNSHMDRLLNWIDDAKANGQWVVVGMHKNCITAGAKLCEIGKDLFNQLISKKVDLILQGHDHNYQRSKQLAHGSGCSSLTPLSYDADCVADNGSDGQYTRGKGPVVVISGLGGKSNYPVRSSDREANYFAKKFSGADGYLKVTVASSSLDARFARASGSGADSFSISGSQAVVLPARNTTSVSNVSPPSPVSLTPSPNPMPIPNPAPFSNTRGNSNAQELSAMMRNWKSEGIGLAGDLNHDNAVNAHDLSILLVNWGS